MQELMDSGRPVMACFPLYPPLELLHSMGFNPVVLWGLKPHLHSTSEGDKHVQTFACSVGRHLAEFLLSERPAGLDNVFFYNACDTLRNLPEILGKNWNRVGHEARFFHFHVPMYNLSGESGRRYFHDEVSRLVSALESASHVPFSSKNFRSSVEKYRRMRASCAGLQERVSSGQLSFTRYAQAVQAGYLMPVERAIERFDAMSREEAPIQQRDGFRKVMVSGIMPPPPAMSDAIEHAGLVVATNDIASIQRSIMYTPEARDDPGVYYADFYSRHCPCPTLLFTADQRVEFLIGEARRAGVDGVIFIGEKFCEYEYLEFPRIESTFKQNGIPVLSLEVSIDDQDNIAPFKNRIDAFAELLGVRRV
jgi:benzoyl-CoA reductase/2-hydroxyglutaryl-CoA dehydratase subunit BcrC/BadD/HgdB